MLNIKSKLIFPTLYHDGHIPFHEWGGKKNDRMLWRLSWDDKFFGSIPWKYQHLLTERFAFVIDREFSRSIRHHSRAALMSWVYEAPHGRQLIDVSKEPAVTHTYAAFRMLADCLVDLVTGTWFRADGYHIKTQMLLTKMWVGQQTSTMSVQDNADYESLHQRLKFLETNGIKGQKDAEEHEEITQFLETMDTFFQAQLTLSEAKREAPRVTVEEKEAWDNAVDQQRVAPSKEFKG